VRIPIKRDGALIFFFVFLGVLLVTLLVCLLILRHIATLQIQSANERYESYQLATELRQSSDDLSKMVRMYVSTGNTKYRDFFYEILSIRAGTSKRPQNYHQIYWDLVLDPNKRPRPFEKAKSLMQQMIDHGFTLKEFALLKEAEDRSNALARMEVRAINAMQGKFDNGSGQYTVTGKPDSELAKRLVFSDEYMQQKASIMTPIQQFFQSVEERTHNTNQIFNRRMLLVIVFAIILAVLSTLVMIISLIKALRTLSKATQENELLLLNILPGPIADRLKLGEEQIADEYPQASVLFADIVGFTEMTFEIGVQKMVRILNQLFELFDNLTEKYKVEKVKTIGDNYMAVSGVPVQTTEHAIRLADYALAIRETLIEFNKKNNLDLKMRMGMTYGAVIAGVIGHKKFIYDIWGDVVNTASRMESTSIPGRIQITEKMALMLEDLFIVEKREEIEVKGIGRMQTYFLLERRASRPRKEEPDEKKSSS